MIHVQAISDLVVFQRKEKRVTQPSPLGPYLNRGQDTVTRETGPDTQESRHNELKHTTTLEV